MEPLHPILTDKEYAALTAQAANYRTILRFLKASGLDSFLLRSHLLPLDLTLTPDDKSGGDSINAFLKAFADEGNRMDKKITQLSQALVDTTLALSHAQRAVQARPTVVRRLVNRLLRRSSPPVEPLL